MVRLKRIDEPGLLQHVICRGIRREEIFLDERDYEYFLKSLEIVIEEAKDSKCYAWTLMPNHIHLNKKRDSI